MGSSPTPGTQALFWRRSDEPCLTSSVSTSCATAQRPQRGRVRDPNVTLGLWQPETEGVPFTPNTAGIALRVPDVEAARVRLTERQVEFLGETLDTGCA